MANQKEDGGVRGLIHHLIGRVTAKHNLSVEALQQWRMEEIQNAIDDARADALAEGYFSEGEAARVENLSEQELVQALEESKTRG